MMLALLLPAALAEAPSAEFRANTSLGAPAQPGVHAAGLGASLSWALPGPLRIEGAADLGYGRDGLRAELRPELRLILPETVAQVSVSAGAGLLYEQRLLPEASLGLAIQAPAERRLLPKLEMRYLRASSELSVIQVSLGLRLGPPSPKLFPDEAWYWLPHPYCQFVDAEELARLQATLTVQPERVSDELARSLREDPPTLEREPEDTRTLAPLVAVPITPVSDPAPSVAATRGSMVVRSNPNELLLADGVNVATGDSQVSLLTFGAQAVHIQAQAGGRLYDTQVQVPPGQVLWVRVPPPAPMNVYFSQGSSTVSQAELAHLQQIASMAQGWRFEVQGSYSPEGSPEYNLALAAARAQAAQVALVAAGVPEKDVTVRTDPKRYPVGSPPEVMRSCIVRPIPPEEP